MAGEPSLVRLAEDMGTALLDWARSSSSSSETYVSPDNGSVVVTPESTLVFNRDKPQLDLELPRLARILANASQHAGYIFEYLGSGSLPSGRERNSAKRKAVTIRDSLFQMSLLVSGKDLDEELLDADPQIDEHFWTLREAEIYRRLKTIQTAIRSAHVLDKGWASIELENVLVFIRDQKPIEVENDDDN